ncbi:hypothetical protein HMPREF0972_02544 [Actinomyces sp. oral taxon 848 str. F0332]|nr:hypothetical protein HMPREF0972_02544 [Actinomyces sp. oral taxon 848 str. F0332]
MRSAMLTPGGNSAPRLETSRRRADVNTPNRCADADAPTPFCSPVYRHMWGPSISVRNSAADGGRRQPLEASFHRRRRPFAGHAQNTRRMHLIV